MFQMLKLLLPALIPSWNFFDVIADSPRVEYSQTSQPLEADGGWRAFQPRPQHVSFFQMLGRLFWNPRWNEALFVVGCAERLMTEPTEQIQDEIFRRIAADLAAGEDQDRAWLCFRIVLVTEQEGAITSDVAFVSETRRLASIHAQ